MTGEMVIRGLLYFMIYSFFGWIMEFCYRGIRSRQRMNRGMLYGPFLLVFGACSVVLLSIRLLYPHYPLLSFFPSLILFFLLQYLAELVVEKVFHIRWAPRPVLRFFSLSDKAGFPHTLYRSACAAVLLTLVHPFLSTALHQASRRVLWAAAFFSLIYLIIDLRASYRRVIRFRKIMLQLVETGKQVYEKNYPKPEDDTERTIKYETGTEASLQEWRRKVEEARSFYREGRIATYEEFLHTVEQANEALRLVLRMHKEEMVDGANARELRIQVFEEGLHAEILKALVKFKQNGEYQFLDRQIRAYPDFRPSTGKPAASMHTGTRASSGKANPLPARGSRKKQPPAEDVSVQVWLEIKQYIQEMKPGDIGSE
ncbi:MAG: putative ABC transporter permease [Clostridiales bacterium]|nr:putative ABC transporter permease [Clostridiales bacterium]